MPQTLTEVRKAPCRNTMGIELECFVNYIPINQVKDFYRHHGFFYAGSDVSILAPSGQDSVEFVSQPLTPRWLERELFKLKKRVGHWDVNDSCGIHVHVNKEWLSDRKAEVLFASLCKVTEDFSWRTMQEVFGREGNSYCIWGNTYSRYRAINIRPQHTVEFRMFSSGDERWAIYCVRLVEWMVNNWKGVRKTRLLEASARIKQEVSNL